jgi:cation diffusion facilitator CzcD-associated flavoprotein CzcO
MKLAIIGSGFGGLAAAIRMKQSDGDDFVVLERAADLGGVWRDNRYPGCVCDVESHLYSLSFVPNPNWSRQFSPQPEIHAYLKQCTRAAGVLPHVRFSTNVQRVAWDEAAGEWLIDTSQGEYRARFVLSAMGTSSNPLIPDLKRLERFRGLAFHSTDWPQNIDLNGKTVAVVGTGASAVQFIPKIQPGVAKLHIFQRTAPWVMPVTTVPSARKRKTDTGHVLGGCGWSAANSTSIARCWLSRFAIPWSCASASAAPSSICIAWSKIPNCARS